MRINFIFFFLIIPSLVFANELPYDGKEPLLKDYSADMGYDYEYMRLCGGEMYIKAEEIRKKVKNLSTPDYKIFNRERLMEFSKNYSHAINCQERKKEKISDFDYYISQLEKKVNMKINPYYVCVNENGRHSMYESDVVLFENCTAFESKEKAQIRVDYMNSLLDKKLEQQKEEEKRKEQERLEEEKRLAEEKRKEQERLEEERRIAEEKRLAEEKILNRKISMIPSESELQLAIEFLQNIETFVKNNPEEFDIIDITELVINTKPILDSNWNDQLKIDFDYLKEFAEQSTKFNEFKKNYDQKKLDRNIKQVDLKIDLLEKNIYYLKNYLRENVTSEFAKSILELIKIAESTLNDSLVLSEFDSVNSSIDDLKNEIKEIENLLVNLNNNALKLSEYLQENMTSDLAPEVMQLIKKTESVKEGGKSSVEIRDVNNEVVNFIKKHIEKEILPNIKTDKTFGPGSQTGTDDETIISTNSTVTKGITLPQDQLDFINAVEQSKTKKWEDEFELGDILQDRNKNLENIINFDKYIVGYDTKYAEIKNWIGVVTERASNSEGKGELYIDIVYFAEGKKSETVSFELRTSSNEFSDLLMGAETLIDPEEKMYDQMRKVKKKDIVIFSGSFFKVDDVIATNDLTKKTKVKKPSFLFKFTELEKFSLTNNNQ